jgi:hypothetical protein
MMKEPEDFIEAYRATWERVLAAPEEVNLLTPFFRLPCSSVGADGTVSCFSDAAEIQAFLQSRLDSFLKGGAVSVHVWGVESLTLASNSVLIMVNWELRRADQSVERAYRICYNVVEVSGDWKILVLTYQGGS